MARKYSEAKILCARLNPINPREKKALEYIWQARREGFNFKQVVVDAINARAGHTPEMFDVTDMVSPSQFAGIVQSLLDQFGADLFERFSAELLEKLGTGEVQIRSTNYEEDAEQDDGLSAFAKNFSKGLLQRQRVNAGEDEE